MIDATYVLPLATTEPVDELAAYVRRLATVVDEVIVVDGSPADHADRHRAAFGDAVIVVPPDERTRMGKVGGVLTGVRLATHEAVVIGDDDVRYDEHQLARVVDLLGEAAVVRPQNWFEPLPWHARFDTARTLLNRLTGGDWPGTLGVRRSVLLRAGGYAGDVLFENLELVRTVEAAGGRHVAPLDLLVRRIPPTTAHFLGQQVRQAYDELARPARLAGFLAVAPLAAAAVASGRRRIVAVAALLTVGAAEVGRRRAGGAEVFPATSSLLAPAWVLERSVCSWVAVGARARGGARYRDGRLRRAATPLPELRRRVAAAAVGTAGAAAAVGTDQAGQAVPLSARGAGGGGGARS